MAPGATPAGVRSNRNTNSGSEISACTTARLGRPDWVFSRPFGFRNEGSRNLLRTRLNLDRRSHQVVGEGGVRIDGKQCHPLTVHGAFDLLAFTLVLAPQRTANVVIERH